MAETEKEGRPPENKRSRKPAHPVKREINEEMKAKDDDGLGGKLPQHSCTQDTPRLVFNTNSDVLVCDWCKHIRHTKEYLDFGAGERRLQFCSAKCLNQYKMDIFYKETQAALPAALCNPGHGSGGDAKLDCSGMQLLTPESWGTPLADLRRKAPSPGGPSSCSALTPSTSSATSPSDAVAVCSPSSSSSVKIPTPRPHESPTLPPPHLPTLHPPVGVPSGSPPMVMTPRGPMRLPLFMEHQMLQQMRPPFLRSSAHPGGPNSPLSNPIIPGGEKWKATGGLDCEGGGPIEEPVFNHWLQTDGGSHRSDGESEVMPTTANSEDAARSPSEGTGTQGLLCEIGVEGAAAPNPSQSMAPAFNSSSPSRNDEPSIEQPNAYTDKSDSAQFQPQALSQPRTSPAAPCNVIVNGASWHPLPAPNLSFPDQKGDHAAGEGQDKEKAANGELERDALKENNCSVREWEQGKRGAVQDGTAEALEDKKEHDSNLEEGEHAYALPLLSAGGCMVIQPLSKPGSDKAAILSCSISNPITSAGSPELEPPLKRRCLRIRNQNK
ncbi:unnamed protein product, partial [Tetraodon nigroviridis]